MVWVTSPVLPPPGAPCPLPLVLLSQLGILLLLLLPLGPLRLLLALLPQPDQLLVFRLLLRETTDKVIYFKESDRDENEEEDDYDEVIGMRPYMFEPTGNAVPKLECASTAPSSCAGSCTGTNSGITSSSRCYTKLDGSSGY